MGEPDGNLGPAKQFYSALRAGDIKGILNVLHPGFRALLTAGLPFGWGGSYTSARDLMERCWRPMFQRAEVRPLPREYLRCDLDRVVVLGDYQIRTRQGAGQINAAFVHVLDIDDLRIRRLVQVTDSARWHEALGNASLE